MRRPAILQHKDFQALGFLALLWLLLLWPVTFGGKLFLPADMLMVMQPWKAHAREMGFERVQTPLLDAIQQAYPWRKYAAEQMRRGIIPLWNPYMNCGTPFIANNQSACFYPETWLFLLMPPERAFGWAALFSLLLGGTFMYFFLRACSLRRLSCLFGCIAFCLSGFIVGWMLLPTIRAVPMWLPLMLLGIEHIVRAAGKAQESLSLSAGFKGVSILAIATGMQFLAGHLHASFFVLLITAIYGLFRLIQLSLCQGLKMAGTAGGLCVAGAIIGTGLAMIQLLPVYELIRMNPRAAGLSFADVRRGAMIPAYALLGLMPDIFGNPVDYNFWGKILSPSAREYVETSCYVGTPTLLLMTLAVLWRRRKRDSQIQPKSASNAGLRHNNRLCLKKANISAAQPMFWLGMWIGGIGLAWGTGLYYVLYVLFPPLRQLPGVSRAVLICCFAAAMLSAYGYEALCRRIEEKAYSSIRHTADVVAIALGLMALIGGVAVWIYSAPLESVMPGIGIYTLAQIGRFWGLMAMTIAALGIMTWTVNTHVPLWRFRLGQGLLLGLLALDLGYFAGHFWPAVPEKYLHVPSAVLAQLKDDTGLYRMTSLIGEERGIDRMPPNLPMAFGLQDVQGSDSLVFKGYTELWGIIPKDDKGNPRPDSPLLDMLNCKYLVTSLDLSQTPGWRKIMDYETGLWENIELWPRAYIASSWETLSADEALKRLAEHPEQAKYNILLSSPDGAALPLPSTKTNASIVAVSIGRYDSNIVTIKMEEGNQILQKAHKKLLVLADILYPGWRVYGDGQELPLWPANYILRGVWLPYPVHRIDFVYFPASFAAGAFMACVSLLLLCAGLAMSWQIGQRERHNEAG